MLPRTLLVGVNTGVDDMNHTIPPSETVLQCADQSFLEVE